MGLKMSIDREQIEESLRLSAPSIYEVISHEGQEELERPLSSLFWSGIAAGLSISFSFLGMAYIYFLQGYNGHEGNYLLVSLGYTFGFLIVVMGRMQLFTENTITVILPLLERKTLRSLILTLRLWGIVFVTNMMGTCLVALLISKYGFASEGQLEAMVSVAMHAVDKDFMTIFINGIPAGFLIAAMVWMSPSANSKVLVILIMTYLIAIGGFSHVVAGSAEAFTVAFTGDISWAHAITYVLAAGAGNIIGGSGLFALIAYGQVKDEM